MNYNFSVSQFIIFSLRCTVFIEMKQTESNINSNKGRSEIMFTIAVLDIDDPGQVW